VAATLRRWRLTGADLGRRASRLWLGVLRYGMSAETRTLTVGSLVIAQLLYALNCRSNGVGAADIPDRRLPNRALTGALAVSFALQGAGMLAPGLRQFLGIAPLGLLDIGVMLGAGVLPDFPDRALRGITRAAAPRPLR
jgi:hypothetical protein